MKKSKIFALLLTLIMVFSMLPMSVLAADDSCGKCGSTNRKTVVEVIKPATCSEQGRAKDRLTCANCGKFFTYTSGEYSIEKLEHTPVTLPAVDPTCTRGGVTEGTKCGVCGEILEAQVDLAPKRHTPEETVSEIPASCFEDGKKITTTSCTVCKETLDTQQESIPARGEHGETTKEMTIITAPTCTEEGVQREETKCLDCGKVISSGSKEYIPATGHTEGEAVKENEKAATCEAAGSYDEVVHCTVCKEELSRETKTVAALGHKWDAGVVTKKPTATAKGVTTYTCQNDKSHTKTAEIAALGTSSNAGLDDVPKTGDITPVVMFGGMMIVALFGAVVIFFSAKKRNNH